MFWSYVSSQGSLARYEQLYGSLESKIDNLQLQL